MQKLGWVLIFLIVGALGVQTIRLHALRSERTDAQAERDSLAADAAAERARADGWAALFAEVAPDLQARIAALDSSGARLASDLRASGLRVQELARVNVGLRGQLEAEAEPDPVEPGQTVAWSWRGRFDDGLLSGSYLFTRIAPARLEMDYGLRIPLAWVSSVSGDRRLLLTVRSPDPRVTPEVEEFSWAPPPAEIRFQCTVQRQAWVGIGGVALGLWMGLSR